VTELAFPDPPLTDRVVTLRRWHPADVPFVVAACQDPAAMPFLPDLPRPYTEADALEWFVTHEPNRLARRAINFAVCRAAGGEPLGAVGLNRLDPELNLAEVGYWLAPAARGFGYMSRAVRLLARWGFGGCGFGRLQLTTDPDNVASQRVAERSGFHREGYLRSHLLVRRTGERRDSVLFGLLPDDLTDE
jgi:RimJ/RimL family protein N-acetyltransferase